MARRRRENSDSGPSVVNIPAQQDEGDILEEIGAELDENGGARVNEETIREIGAVDAASVIENRRIQTAVNKKRNGEKNVLFNPGDLIEAYDTAAKTWPPNTFNITVKRLTGTPVTHTITSRPRSGVELYDAIMVKHGQYEEAEYEVKVTDSALKQFRVNSRITMPDTRQSPQQGQPMNPQYPYGAPPVPPGYPPQYAQPYGYLPQQPPQPQPAQPQPAPQAQPLPPPPQVFMQPPPFDPMAMMQQMFSMFQQMQTSAQPPPQPFAPPQPVAQPQMPPMPAPTASPGEMMAWMQEAFRMFQQISAQPAARIPNQQPPPPPPPQPNPMMGMMGMPPMQPPPGMMWVPGLGFAPMDRLAQIFGAPPSAQEPPQYRGPMYRGRPPEDQGTPTRPQYGGPRPPYYSRGEPQYEQQQPPRERTVGEQFRDSLTVVRSAVEAVQEMSSMLPQQQGAHEAPEPEEDDSPVRVIDTGPAKIVVNKSDGSTRLWETGIANMASIAKWVGEQHQVIQKAHNERQQSQQPRQQLPPGYVEVGPNYRPPPGFVAVPVDPPPYQQPQPQAPAPQSDLPPVPQQVPPPIQEAPRPPWGAPTIPFEQEEQ